MSNWQFYEEFVADLMTEHNNIDAKVVPNAKILGAISGIKRQVDVLVDAKWNDTVSRRIIIDAKPYRKEVDAREVEKFNGMMRDCRAQHGVLVCPDGFTEAAQQCAQHAGTIKLLPLDDPSIFNLHHWNLCCGGCSGKQDPKKRGLVLYDDLYALSSDNPSDSVFAVGKCDQCHDYHVWCWECADIFALANDDHRECKCSGKLWVTSMEEHAMRRDGTPRKLAHLLLSSEDGNTVFPIDRQRV